MNPSFISTAIPFVNARPHLGFAYELVLGDILARHRRARGRDVRYVNGTDENSRKNAEAAARENIPVRALVDRNAAVFRDLGPLLHVAPDDFVRTSVDPRHVVAVEWLWRACAARGDLYRRRWSGRYCLGCEAFLDGDACPEHAAPPELIAEDNWFFRLSRYREPVREAIQSGRLAIVPDAARAETIAFLAGEVRDLSVSRDAARAASWGIPVPGDPTQVIYVWFDALTSYLTSLGLGQEGTALFDRYWRAGDRTHVIGKGISRFHAVYWPAFLLSAGLPLPDRIFVHGYLTLGGVKISKSGAGAEVGPVARQFGSDALRWYYARRCRTRADSDLRPRDIAAAHDVDLADRLGNLVQRTSALAARIGAGRVARPVLDTPPDAALRALADGLPARVDAALADFRVDDAAAVIVALVDAANRTLDATAPWRLTRTDPAAAAAALHAPLTAARVATAELAPFVPGTAQILDERLREPLREEAQPIRRIGG